MTSFLCPGWILIHSGHSRVADKVSERKLFEASPQLLVPLLSLGRSILILVVVYISTLLGLGTYEISFLLGSVRYSLRPCKPTPKAEHVHACSAFPTNFRMSARVQKRKALVLHLPQGHHSNALPTVPRTLFAALLCDFREVLLLHQWP